MLTMCFLRETPGFIPINTFFYKRAACSKFECIYKSLGDLVKMHSLILYVWQDACDSSFLTSSKVMLMLFV